MLDCWSSPQIDVKAMEILFVSFSIQGMILGCIHTINLKGKGDRVGASKSVGCILTLKSFQTYHSTISSLEKRLKYPLRSQFKIQTIFKVNVNRLQVVQVCLNCPVIVCIQFYLCQCLLEALVISIICYLLRCRGTRFTYRALAPALDAYWVFGSTPKTHLFGECLHQLHFRSYEWHTVSMQFVGCVFPARKFLQQRCQILEKRIEKSIRVGCQCLVSRGKHPSC